MLHGLRDLFVVDFSDTIAGSYATKLLADAGATVVKVEPATGDPLRRWSEKKFRGEAAVTDNGDSALFQFLNTAKQSVIGTPEEAHIRALLHDADIVVNTFAPGVLHVERFREEFPRAVLLSITPFGHTGPYRDRAATEFIVQAESGSLSGRGLPSQPPCMAGGRITEWVGGTHAAVAALAACRRAQDSGEGDHIDFSLLEVMNIAGTNYVDLMASLAGRRESSAPQRTVEIPSIEPTQDGWVGFTTNSFQQYSDFLLLINRQDLLEQKDLANVVGRTARMDEWNAAVHAWTRQHTTADIVAAAATLRIPVAPVNNGATVLEHEHFRARGVFVRNPGGNFLQPRSPYQINGQSPPITQAAPALGQHQHLCQQQRARRVPVPPTAAAPRLPLAGIRVLDATAWWAGPAATQMLAHLGAEVIHLEAIQRVDGMRMLGGRFMRKPQWWEYSGMFLGANTNKLGLTLDLDQAEGVAVAKELIAACDVFVENYSPRVMEKFGLDWNTVHALNPRTTMVRMPAFGLSGPWKDHVGFAQTMEQITGMAWITGFIDDQPRIQRGPCDPLAGMHAAFATLVALAERERTGEGSFVECPMVEGALNAAAEQIVEFSAYGTLMQRAGNRCVQAAPQGLYACLGHRPESEQWLALSIETRQQWASLKKCLGEPPALEEASFASHAARLRNHDALDTRLHALLAQHALDAILEQLVQQRVPAGRVWPGMQSVDHPQLRARGFLEALDHPVVGTHSYVTVPFASRHTKRWLHRHAPVVGEHNHQILQAVLGYSEERIAQLEALQVIGSTPTGLGI
jgi:crotonobetainyl-CoA:carnitine CoA-transferase CaiB-like acyl-CoA transferase